MDLQPIHTFADLRQFGINALTGESCVYSMRVLCDLDEQGVALMIDYLGLLPGSTPFAPNWNSSVDGKPAVASIMLDRDCLSRLAVFASFRAGALAVALGGDGTVVPLTTPERVAEYGEFAAKHPEKARLWRNPATIPSEQPRVGSRNVHLFSGRTT
jgi:hypothetical protein